MYEQNQRAVEFTITLPTALAYRNSGYENRFSKDDARDSSPFSPGSHAIFANPWTQRKTKPKERLTVIKEQEEASNPIRTAFIPVENVSQNRPSEPTFADVPDSRLR